MCACKKTCRYVAAEFPKTTSLKNVAQENMTDGFTEFRKKSHHSFSSQNRGVNGCSFFSLCESVGGITLILVALSKKVCIDQSIYPLSASASFFHKRLERYIHNRAYSIANVKGSEKIQTIQSASAWWVRWVTAGRDPTNP